MLEEAEQHVGELKELLKTPTPANFEAANQKLASVMMALQSLVSDPSLLKLRTATDTAFLTRLQPEMQQIRKLFQGPVDYLEGLALFRTRKFGCYTRSGELKGLSQQSGGSTIAHL